jgi:hypothetical protein
MLWIPSFLWNKSRQEAIDFLNKDNANGQDISKIHRNKKEFSRKNLTVIAHLILFRTWKQKA